jgi:hypothetical protein
MTTGGMADDRNTGEVQHRSEPLQGVDRRRHVRERALPASPMRRYSMFQTA